MTLEEAIKYVQMSVNSLYNGLRNYNRLNKHMRS